MTSCRLPGCHVTPFTWLDPYYCQPSHREQHTHVTLVDEPETSWTNSTAHTADAPSWLAHILSPSQEGTP